MSQIDNLEFSKVNGVLLNFLVKKLSEDFAPSLFRNEINFFNFYKQ